jgi:primosomal protein N' (replication factor Y)
LIAKVVVDVPAKAVDRPFDYLIPSDLEDVIEIGQRVKVPFGPRLVMGYVVGFAVKSEFKKLKAIETILDMDASLTTELIDLGKMMKKTTISPLVSIYQSMLPTALKVKYTKTVVVLKPHKLTESLRLIMKNRSEVPYDELPKSALSSVKKLMNEGVIDLQQDLHLRERKKTVDYLTFIKDTKQSLGKKQRMVLEYLKQNGETTKKEVLNYTKAPNSTILSLVKKGFIKIESKEIYRHLTHIYKPSNKKVTLTNKQKDVEDRIITKLGMRETILLHGVTGSGKTELYLNIIERVVNDGKEAILLVPEISLTPMMASRFKGRFNDNVALLHSGLSMQEKYDEWRKVKRKEVQVVVGARSAIFAPFENLGVIIIDEEHTDSYKQDTPPTYHARDVAFMRADTYQIPVILGSATPSVESYYHAAKGEYMLLNLTERANDTTLPKVHIEDMRLEFEAGNRTIFSQKLRELINDRLQKKEKIMLLLNRRGHSTFVMCRSCGEVIMCPNCDISLTYHEDSSSLKCHYCGHQEKSPSLCPNCQSSYIRYMGLGTEQAEEIVKREYPNAYVIRMDRDTTTRKNAHEQLLYDFEQKGDILIGTQMIAKGLDFRRVTLVGVLAADMSLKLPDYKATEKTFQLLTQVAGRAGRHDLLGEVVIQTYNPNHYAIKAAKNHDYKTFYNTEMRIRTLAGYAPVVNLIQIITADKDVKFTLKTASKIVYDLKRLLPSDTIILGPVLPKVARIKSMYRAQIIIKDKHHRLFEEELYYVFQKYQDIISIAIDRHPDLL